MIIREWHKPVKFEDINTIVISAGGKKVLSSNHPKYPTGCRVDEGLYKVVNRGWPIIKNSPHKLLTEQLSVEDLLDQIILPTQDEDKWTVFLKGDVAVFAQRQGDRVCMENEEGDVSWFDTTTEFLQNIPGFTLDGQIDSTDLDDEQKEGEEEMEPVTEASESKFYNSLTDLLQQKYGRGMQMRRVGSNYSLTMVNGFAELKPELVSLVGKTCKLSSTEEARNKRIELSTDNWAEVFAALGGYLGEDE